MLVGEVVKYAVFMFGWFCFADWLQKVSVIGAAIGNLARIFF
jgi:hypothetical protein